MKLGNGKKMLPVNTGQLIVSLIVVFTLTLAPMYTYTVLYSNICYGQSLCPWPRGILGPLRPAVVYNEAQLLCYILNRLFCNALIRK